MRDMILSWLPWVVLLVLLDGMFAGFSQARLLHSLCGIFFGVGGVSLTALIGLFGGYFLADKIFRAGEGGVIVAMILGLLFAVVIIWRFVGNFFLYPCH